MIAKYFVIGFNKCATSTFHELFIQNKLKSQHASWPTKWDVENFDCFSDNGHLNNFQLLEHKYPNSTFILNTRPLNKWLISRFEHGVREQHWPLINLRQDWPNWAYPCTKELVIKWINHRHDYYLELLNYFKNKSNKLIIVDISIPNWIEYICKELEFKKSKIKSQNIYKKSYQYIKISNLVNEVFKELNYDIEQQKLVLLKEKNEQYLNLYRTNIK